MIFKILKKCFDLLLKRTSNHFQHTNETETSERWPDNWPEIFLCTLLKLDTFNEKKMHVTLLIFFWFFNLTHYLNLIRSSYKTNLHWAEEEKSKTNKTKTNSVEIVFNIKP